MFDSPIGDKSNTPPVEAVVVVLVPFCDTRARRTVSIINAVALAKLVIVTDPIEGMYAGARIEIKEPGEGFDEKNGVQLNVKLTLG